MGDDVAETDLARGRWVADTIVEVARGETPRDELLGEHAAEPAAAGQTLADFARAVGPSSLVRISPGRRHQVEVFLESESGRRWTVTCTLEPDPPHRLTGLDLARTLPPGTIIRTAAGEDAAALAEVFRVPIKLGDGELTIDVGDDYSVVYRTMENVCVVVAEVDGRPVGVHCGTVYPARIGGRDLMAGLLHHTRLLPEHQRGGIYSGMNKTLVEWFRPRCQVMNTYIDPRNDAARRLTVVDAWPVKVLRALLPAVELAGPPEGRRAQPSDADRIAHVLNELHGGEEMFVPRTAASVRERFGRAPDVYGWDDAIIGDTAIVGMSRTLERRTWTAGGVTTGSTRATVFDYGFSPGSEHEVERLLRDRCRVAVERGCSHVAVFTSEASPSRPLLEKLAQATEVYEFRTAFLDPPSGVDGHGIFVDPINL